MDGARVVVYAGAFSGGRDSVYRATVDTAVWWRGAGVCLSDQPHERMEVVASVLERDVDNNDTGACGELCGSMAARRT